MMKSVAPFWLALLAFIGSGGLGGAVSAEEAVSFGREIRPILSNHCFACHGPDEETREADLRLDVREDALSVISVGKAAESELVQRLWSDDADERMPPPHTKKLLSQEEKRLLERWIDEGAIYEKHWAFEPVKRRPLPSVDTVGEELHSVDRFIDARMKQQGLESLGRADRFTLIRRLYIDMLGLQPALETVDAFVVDPSPQAYDRLVDRVLASPHYGERWGRHWLDQARYADSDGYAIDGERSMWLYRNWVIDALNADLPFDRFTVEQLAGDLLPQASQDQRIATGFHRNTLINTEGGTDAEQFRVEAAIDRTNTTGAVWMGLTVGCAQCHTHKFDPLTHREYYQMYAFFNNGEDRNGRHPVLTLRSEEDKVALEGLRRSLGELDPKRDKEAVDRLKKEIREVERRAPSVMIMGERKERRPTHVHLRGDFLRHGEEVEPGVPGVLPPMAAKGALRDLRDRLDLARWLVDPAHPLTARVTVNRLWMHHFGRGLVETENDFGLQGTLPTHPDLLDWLASEFVQRGWSMKALHRLVVTSAAYARSSEVTEALATRDPRNLWLARQHRPRVEAEVVRDLALSSSGLLTRRLGGPSVYPPQPKGIYAFTQQRKSWRESQGEDRYRRGMYTFFYRSAPHPLLATFDTPNFQALCTRRERSNTPLQALQVANDPMFIEFARALGRQGSRGALGPVRVPGIQRLFRQGLTRPPTARETEVLASFWKKQHDIYAGDDTAARALAGDLASWPKGMSGAEAAAWTALGRVVLNLDEFVSRG